MTKKQKELPLGDKQPDARGPHGIKAAKANSKAFTLNCEACGHPFTPAKKGRPGKFCSVRCRVWNYRAGLWLGFNDEVGKANRRAWAMQESKRRAKGK